MKKLFFALLLLPCIFMIQSCENKTKEPKEIKTEVQEKNIMGTWTLFKEVKNGQQIDHIGKPTAVSLTLKENGFYIFYDKITDKKISDSGVDEIQERYKGQYQQTNEQLIMNHFVNDSLVSNTYQIKSLTDSELVLVNKKTNEIQYYKK